jgi:hypothetical protein
MLGASPQTDRGERFAMADLTEIDEQLCATSPADFCDLRALYVNCTLKRSPQPSHTQALADRSIAIMERVGVAVEVIRAIDHEIATGVHPDMTEHGWERDDWSAISEPQTRRGSTRTPGAPAAASSRATRTAPSTAR